MSKTKQDSNIVLSYSLLYPKTEKAIPVPISQWEQFVQRIERSVDHSPSYNSVGSACIGMAASTLLTALVFPFSVAFVARDGQGHEVANMPAIFTQIVLALGVLVSAAIGVIALLYARRHREDKNDMRKYVIEDMRQFAERHGHNTEAQTEEPPPP